MLIWLYPISEEQKSAIFGRETHIGKLLKRVIHQKKAEDLRSRDIEKSFRCEPSKLTGNLWLFHVALLYPSILEDQTQMEWKPAGQPEHASLNQCQLIVANRRSGHPQQVVEIRFLCNVIDAGALIGPCSHVTSPCCLIW